MSVGPAALGTVLVQRLDAVLGTTMAANANLSSGARSDAVTQPGAIERLGELDTAARDARQGLQSGGTRGERQHTVVDAKTAAALALAARGLVTSNETTASAPTTLGQTARSILALLAQYPDAAPPVAGKAALWQPAGTGQADASPSTQTTSAPGQTGAQGSQAAQSAPSPTGALPAATASASPTATAQGSAAPSNPPSPSTSPHRPNAVTQTAFASQVSQAPQVAQLAQALRHVLQSSGLFYESHLADVAFGKRTPAQLEDEPQAKLKNDAAAADGANSAARGKQSADTSTQPARASLLSSGSEASPAHATSSNNAPGTPIAGIHQDTTVLVRQQLEVLANQALTWQGEAWPGTPMEWEVERDPYGGDPDSATSTWATRLKLNLPRLGLVEARLNLAGDQVVLQLVAPLSASEIRASSESLRTRLQATGLTLTNLSVDMVDPQFILPPQY